MPRNKLAIDYVPPSRDHCWTLNNYTDEEVEHIKQVECRYLVFGKEIAPTTGTPHLQGYIYLHQPQSLMQLKALLGPRVSFKDAYGNVLQNTNYTCKDEDIWKKGKAPKQGKRNDFGAVRDCIRKTNLNDHELLKHHPGCVGRYPKFIEHCREVYHPYLVTAQYKDFNKPFFTDFKTMVFVGPPRIGKTQFALAHFERPFFCTHLDQLPKFKPDFHDGMVFDDVDFSLIPRSQQIFITDWDQPRAIHIRYKVTEIPACTRKIFCCNPQAYPFKDDEAINERVTIIRFEREKLFSIPI